jgi:protocatechuate 3,4-dioxygenase beta subunit
MRVASLALLAVAALVALAWFVLPRGESLDRVSGTVVAGSGDAGRERPSPARVAVEASRSVERPEQTGRVELAAPPVREPALDDVPRARVLGRIVDARGEPVAGATLTLTASGTWRDGLEDPVLGTGDDPEHGYEERTDGAGRFAFDVPVPTASVVRLEIVASPFDGTVSRSFGAIRGGEPRLARGDNDLGVMALPAAGVVTGTVLGDDGRPVEGAYVNLRGDGERLSARTDAEGVWTCAHVPPGAYALRVSASGRFVAEGARVEVEAGKTAQAAAVRLARASTIAGTVVDGDGRPAAGVLVRAVADRSYASGRSDAQGAFTISLAAPGPQRLSVNRGNGYGAWSGAKGDDGLVEPGRSDVRIVLERLGVDAFREIGSSAAETERSARIGIDRIGDVQERRVRIGRRRDHPPPGRAGVLFEITRPLVVDEIALLRAMEIPAWAPTRVVVLRHRAVMPGPGAGRRRADDVSDRAGGGAGRVVLLRLDNQAERAFQMPGPDRAVADGEVAQPLGQRA